MEWLETTTVALAVRDSLLLTGGLSAVHLVGFTLATGGALVANLTMLGVLFRRCPVADVVRPTSRGVAIGLVISVVTGVLLVAPRATAAMENSIFQVKMLLFVAAGLFQLAVPQRVARRVHASAVRRLSGAAGLALWLGLALAGCAFILLE